MQGGAVIGEGGDRCGAVLADAGQPRRRIVLVGEVDAVGEGQPAAAAARHRNPTVVHRSRAWLAAGANIKG